MRTIIEKIDPETKLTHFVLENVNVPIPQKYEIIVQIKACALSAVDSKVQKELKRRLSRESLPVGTDISGIVVRIGPEVTHVAVGDAVVGIVSLDNSYSGCGEYCLLSEYEVAKKPDKLSHIEAAAGIGDCVRAYTSLHYQARLCGGDTVLVVDGALPFGNVTLQLASLWGAKVITTSSSQEEKNYLENFHIPLAQVIDTSKRSNIIMSSVMEETGGLGADIIIDNGVRLFTSEEDIGAFEKKTMFPIPHKQDIISSLAVFGKWITCHPQLQLDPPDSQQLFMRSASISFLFEHVWTLSCSQHGRYQHILNDAIDKLTNGKIRCRIYQEVSLESVPETLPQIEDIRIGKTVVRI